MNQIPKQEAQMTKDTQIEVLCECLSRTIPAAKAYGPLLKAKITNVEDKAQTFCTLVQVCSCTDEVLMKNEMIVEGIECVEWIIEKLREWGKTITLKQVVDSITLLEGKNFETNPFNLRYVNKYPRYNLQTA